MYRFLLIIGFSLFLAFPIFSWAEEWYIGENPGTNFYSIIDDGDYQITRKILTKRLAEKPTLDLFGAECLGNTWVKDAPTDISTLDSIANQDYRKLTEILRKNGVTNISTDTYQSLALCLTTKYQEAKSKARDEQKNIETLSSLGLYMDGDTSNSDYDIISDIEKINAIIFSKEIKYTGETNKSAKSFANFISGKPIEALFGSDTPAGIAGNTIGLTPSTVVVWVTPGSTTSGNLGTTSVGWVSLSSLIGGACEWSTTTTSVENMIDDAFARDLALQLTTWPITYPIGEWYTRNVGETPWVSPTSGNTPASGTSSKNTSASDFFHKMPCTSIFCIKVSMVSGSQNLLGGGKNVSIEWLLDKHTEIMGKVSETALRCEKMTNNFWSFPASKITLKSLLAGARVYSNCMPQATRRDKKDQTPAREVSELEDIRRCAFAWVGLNTDAAKANSLLGAGYSITSATTMENIDNRATSLGPQEAEMSRYVGCLEENITAGRKSYYESFSTDLTETQAFTSCMIGEIKEILDIGILMNTKPMQCPG